MPASEAGGGDRRHRGGSSPPAGRGRRRRRCGLRAVAREPAWPRRPCTATSHHADELLTALIVEAYDAIGGVAEAAATTSARRWSAGRRSAGLRPGRSPTPTNMSSYTDHRCRATGPRNHAGASAVGPPWSWREFWWTPHCRRTRDRDRPPLLGPWHPNSTRSPNRLARPPTGDRHTGPAGLDPALWSDQLWGLRALRWHPWPTPRCSSSTP